MSRLVKFQQFGELELGLRLFIPFSLFNHFAPLGHLAEIAAAGERAARVAVGQREGEIEQLPGAHSAPVRGQRELN